MEMALAETHVVLPGWRGKASLPERNLLVAMIERAVLDYFGNQAMERSEAETWLFGLTHEDEPFSFHWVCGQLDLDPVDITSQIQKMKPRGGTRTQRWWKMRRRV